MNIIIYYLAEIKGLPIYVGKTKNDLNIRRNQHNLRLQSNFEIFELDQVPEEEWEFWEKHYVSLFRSWGFNLVNGNEGGGGPSYHTEETKLKMRGLKHLGTSRKLKGRKRPDVSLKFKGKKCSEEHKRNISLGKKGHECYKDPKRAKKIIKSNKKHYKKNSDRNQKISNKLIGRKAEWMKFRNKPIIQYSKKGIFIREWISASEAGKFLNKSSSSISECCNGKRKSSYGFIWKLKN